MADDGEGGLGERPQTVSLLTWAPPVTGSFVAPPDLFAGTAVAPCVFIDDPSESTILPSAREAAVLLLDPAAAACARATRHRLSLGANADVTQAAPIEAFVAHRRAVRLGGARMLGCRATTRPFWSGPA